MFVWHLALEVSDRLYKKGISSTEKERVRSGCEAKVVCLAGRASALHDTYRCLASRCQNGQEAGLPSEAVLCYIVNVRTFHSPCSSSYYVVVAIAT